MSQLRKYKHAEEHTLVRRRLVDEFGLGDNPDVVLCRDDLEHLGDVGVVQLAVVMDLAREGRRDGLGYLLDSDARLREPVRSHPHLPVRACRSRQLPLFLRLSFTTYPPQSLYPECSSPQL